MGQCFHRRRGSLEGQAGVLAGDRQRQDRPGLERLVHAQGGPEPSSPALREPPAVLPEQGGQPVGGGDGRLGGYAHAFEEERKPGLPVTIEAHAVQQFVIHGPVFVEEQAEIQQRLLEDPGVVQQECDEEPSDTPVAVQERVDGLELHVCQRRSDQNASDARLTLSLILFFSLNRNSVGACFPMRNTADRAGRRAQPPENGC